MKTAIEGLKKENHVQTVFNCQSAQISRARLYCFPKMLHFPRNPYRNSFRQGANKHIFCFRFQLISTVEQAVIFLLILSLSLFVRRSKQPHNFSKFWVPREQRLTNTCLKVLFDLIEPSLSAFPNKSI